MKKKRKVILIILGVVLIVAATAAVYIYKEYNRTHRDTADLKPDYTVSAVDLVKEFEAGEDASNKKYWDQVIEAKGMVKDITKDDKGFYSVVLGDTSSMSSVRCSMDSVHNNEVISLSKGNPAIIRGICSGFNADELLGSDVILVRCALISKK